MERQKYITRYEAEKGSSYTFKGWRLCITRHGERFVRYFSDLKCGGAENGLRSAMKMRDSLLMTLKAAPSRSEEIFRLFRRIGSVGANSARDMTKP